MKRFYNIVLLVLLATSVAFANKDNESQKRSNFNQATTPGPFANIGNAHNSPAISTGYYFVDSDDSAPSFWKPTEQLADTNVETARWKRVIRGPRVLDPTFWDNNKEEGLRFFRNPGHNFFNPDPFVTIDSTDDAIAGPMPMNLVGGFYFNGIRYDSFYVSTNGIIALTNRRYFYDENGDRFIPPGETTAYDPHSMDWFVRGRSGNGLADANVDDWGYRMAVLGNNTNNLTSGIRARGGKISPLAPQPLAAPLASAHRAAVVAFLWGDNQLSQYSESLSQIDDHGKVYYKRSLSNDKLIVYFVNLAAVRNKATLYGNRFIDLDKRPGDDDYISASGQVVFDRNDSSITIIYERFLGQLRFGFRSFPAKDVFRWNSTVGVRGFARHVNYNRTGGPTTSPFPWVAEYEQYTQYFAFERSLVDYPDNFLRIKFKQYQNTLRVVDIQYRVRKQDFNASLDFSEVVPSNQANDYELFAGHERLGALQPVALIQNLSNDIQGPVGTNFVEQDLNFQARFRVINAATGRIIYNRLVPVDNTCLALPEDRLFECTGDPFVRVRLVDVAFANNTYTATPKVYPGTNPWNGKTRNGIPPYEYVQVMFPPFEPNELVVDNDGKRYQIGQMRGFIIGDPTDPRTGTKLGGQWPFDDTAAVRLHVMRQHNNFSDDATEYHIVDGVPIPSVQKWVNIDAEIVNGDIVSRHPLPPRGRYAADNNPNFFRSSPAILMNRKQLNNLDHAPLPGGDVLRSHPIDMRGRRGSLITFSVQRTRDRAFWDRGYGDNQLVGPEPRAVVNGDIFAPFTTGRSASANPDMLALEIMLPSDDGVKNITNVQDARWRVHPRRGGADAETKVPAVGVYGAGGYIIGFLEQDKDSALAEPNTNQRELNSLRANIYDDGYDFEYNKYFVAIPDTFINWQNDGARYFRFRLKVYATNDQKCVTCIPDDDDDFIVDNVRILFRSVEATDIEVSSVKVIWPYTMTPATQATEIPVRVKLTNNTNTTAQGYSVWVKIFKDYVEGGFNLPVYCRQEVVTIHAAGQELEKDFPGFNARNSGPGNYRARAIVRYEGGDLEELNDTTWTDFEIRFGDAFAYEPMNANNDVSGLRPGRGLNLEGFQDGGIGNINGPAGAYNEMVSGAGYIGGSVSGQIAMKFRLLQADTIFGYQAYFGEINQAPDFIAFSIYRGNQNSNQPISLISESVITTNRGKDDVRDDYFYGEYVDYRLSAYGKQPLVLEAGTYWMAISQLGETGLELGASGTRASTRTMSVYIPPPVGFISPVGGSGISLNVHKEFRKLTANGNYINDNYFAFENTRGTNQWNEFTPSQGNLSYAHNHHFGNTPGDPTTLTLTNGSWIPLIRPYLGEKSFNTTLEYVDCPVIPVELTFFRGDSRSNSVDLFWETAQEENNRGFYIEKREYTNQDESQEWNQVAFVEGSGFSSAPVQYNFTDKEVQNGLTYQYRLRQVDFDGTQTCFDSDVVTLTIGGDLEMTLTSQPNPFVESTKISYNVPKNGYVTLEILDIYGNVVRTLASETQSVGFKEIEFDGKDEFNKQLPSGSYIYRLSAGDKVVTSKMTLVK